MKSFFFMQSMICSVSGISFFLSLLLLLVSRLDLFAVTLSVSRRVRVMCVGFLFFFIIIGIVEMGFHIKELE